MKKSLFILFTILFAINLNSKAENFSSVFDGHTIYYRITSPVYPYTVSVTYNGSGVISYFGSLSIPDSVLFNGNYYKVTSIGYNAFWNCLDLTSITIPNSVTSIDIYAFYNCSRLTSITIPNSVTKIGVSAFQFCDSLSSITIPNSVTSIKNDAFANTPYYDSIPDGLVFINDVLYKYKGTMPDSTSINIKSGTVSISPDAFSNRTQLISITIPNSVTSIGERAFSGCYHLNSITIPSSVTSIGYYAFLDCTGLISITIPNSVTTIGGLAFENTGWYHLQPNGLVYINNVLYKYKGTMPENTSINIQSGTVSISGCAFMYCRNLTSITIPNSVTSIGDGAFYGCTGLSSITIPNSVTSIDYQVFYGCTGLTSITLPNYINSIGFGSFYNCSGLTSITIPEYVYSIESTAFYGCTGLTSITIPKYVTYINVEAFYNCSGLTSITTRAITPPDVEYSDSFSGVIKTIPFYVPCVSVPSYNSALYWSDFTNQIGVKTLYNIDTTICQGSFYTDYGANLDSAGVYTLVSGCDSVILILNVNPIPIVPQNLTAAGIHNYIELNWQADGESYDIYRDDIFIANSEQPIYIDSNVINGESYYYYVQSLKGDCKSGLSNVVGMTFIGLDNIQNDNIKSKLYPNPSNGKTKLEIEGLTSQTDVMVYDMIGRIVQKHTMKKGINELNIDLSDYAKGVYSIRIANKTINQTTKLIVQ
ncbi:MAG: leucine-rich repeat domain-containing protein [Bacteroidales bacterium]|nr:leucine-rich repeat domain-containing protein [Bacteroidales bacterium]